MSHYEPDAAERAAIADKEIQEEIKDAHSFAIELSNDDVALLIATNVVSREEAQSTYAIIQAVEDYIHTDLMESVKDFVNFAEKQDFNELLYVGMSAAGLPSNYDSYLNRLDNLPKGTTVYSVVGDIALSDDETNLLRDAKILSATNIDEVVRPHDRVANELNCFLHNYIQNSCRDIIENIKSGYGNEDDFNKNDFMKVYLINDKSSDIIKDYLSSNFHYSEWAEDNKSFSVFVDDLDSTLSMMDKRGINYHLEGGNFKDIIRPASFINDKEKMRDFKELSKEEFLESYSYLTEEEYDLTAKDVAKRDIQRIDGSER